MSGLPPTPTEDELREVERRRLRSLLDRDMPTAESLHAPDYELITPGGVTYDRDGYLGGVARGELAYEVFEAEGDVRCRTWPGGGAVRYRVRIRIAFPGGQEDGRYWHTDLYELRDGRLQAVWSQATQIGRASGG